MLAAPLRGWCKALQCEILCMSANLAARRKHHLQQSWVERIVIAFKAKKLDLRRGCLEEISTNARKLGSESNRNISHSTGPLAVKPRGFRYCHPPHVCTNQPPHD